MCGTPPGCFAKRGCELLKTNDRRCKKTAERLQEIEGPRVKGGVMGRVCEVYSRQHTKQYHGSRAIGPESPALEQSSTPPHQGPKRCSCGAAIYCGRRKRRRIPRARTRQTSRMDPRLCPAGKGWHFSWQSERTMFRLLVQSPGGSSAFRRNRQIVLCHEKKQQPLWKGPLSIGPRSHPGWLVHPWLAGYLRQPKRRPL